MGAPLYPRLQQFLISGKIRDEMKQSNSPHFQKLFLKLVLNDFFVNSVAGFFAALTLYFLEVIQLTNFSHFIGLGLLVLVPMYGIHIIFIFYQLKKSWIPEKQFLELDLQARTSKLKALLAVSFRGTSTIILLWCVAGIYSYYFSTKDQGVSSVMGVLALVTFVGMSPISWLVDSIVTRRVLISTIRRYLSSFPESLLQGFNFYKMSSINRSAVAVFYLFILTIYFTLIGNMNSFNSVMQQKLTEFGKSQLEQITVRIKAESPKKEPSLERVREIIKETPNFLGSEITIVPSNLVQEKQNNLGKTKQQTRWVSAEKKLQGIGSLVFRIEKGSLRSRIFFIAFNRGVIVLFLILLGVGATVLFQVNLEFKGTLSVINQITDEMASGNLSDSARLYATDEFWGLYQKIIVVKNNAGKVIGDIREHARLLNQNIRVVEEVSHFLQELSGDQKPLVRNAGDAVNFVDGFAESLQQAILELSLIAERTSSTSIEFAASINEVKNSMGRLVVLAEAIALNVRENTFSLKDISSDLRTASGMTGQLEENIVEIYDSIGKRFTNLEDSRFSIDRQMDSAHTIEQSFQKVEEHLENLSGMYQNYLKSKAILGKEIDRIESISRIMDDFIDQAGILALNAAILAARNDSLDSGFGVIADEIKELAMRTEESTREIRNIVNNTSQQLSGMEERTAGAKTEFRRAKDLMKEILKVQKTGGDELEEGADLLKALLDDTAQDKTQMGTVLDGVRLLKSQIVKTGEILGEKVIATEKSMETSNKMKELAGQVMSAAQEQTVGANQIAGASESIRDLSSDAKNASEKVKEALHDIVELIQNMEENSEDIRLKSDTLREVVDGFSDELKSFSTEIEKFKLPDNQ